MPKAYITSRRSALLVSAGRPPPYAHTALTRGLGLPPGVYVIDVFHDDDCAIFKGRPCTCSPTVGSPRPA